MIKIVVIDPSPPYASGIRAALPAAKIAVDKWHLVALANKIVTEVRQAGWGGGHRSRVGSAVLATNHQG
jgi:transposase